LIFAGLTMALTGLAGFVDDILARNTSAETKFQRFYSALSDMFVEQIILFSLVLHFYATNYPMMVCTLFLSVLMVMNKDVLSLEKSFKLRKAEVAFYRPEFMFFMTLGLLSNQLTLFMALSFLYALMTSINLMLSVRNHVLVLRGPNSVYEYLVRLFQEQAPRKKK
jgi:hypothetical protein